MAKKRKKKVKVKVRRVRRNYNLVVPSIKLYCVGVHKIQDRMSCSRGYFWRWILNLVPKKINMNFWTGTIVHKGFEMCHKTKNIGKIHRAMDKASKEDLAKYFLDPKESQEIALQLDMYKLIIEVFSKTQRKVIRMLNIKDTEVVFKKNLEMSPVILLGRMDGHGIMKKKLALAECKTASQLNSQYFARLKFDKQINAYAEGLKTIKKKYPAKCGYIVFRKPGIRVRQNETIPQYLSRLEADLHDRQAFYFISYEHSFGKQTIANTMMDIEWETFDMYAKYNYLSTEQLLDPNCWPRNDRACFNYGVCPYFTLCNNLSRYKLYLRLYQMREIRYPEEEAELSPKHAFSLMATSKMRRK